MRLLLLNINYLLYHFFYQNHAEKIMNFEHPTYLGFCFNEVVLLRANKRDHFLRAIVQWRC